MQNQNLIFYYNCMIIYYIVLAFFIIMTIVFACLFIKAKMTYRRLLRKNLDENIAPIELVQKPEVVFSNIKDENEQQILKRLQLLFEEEHIYLNPDLNINDLAKQIGTNKTTLSHIINTHLKINFPTLLNQYRIKESIKLLTDKQYSNYKIEAIGEMCGYKNRQVFHATFKKEMGVTPINFRKISQETTTNKE